MENRKKPLISVIVPIYNVQEYLVECIESIINQTYQNLEIILVDDGSTDMGGAMCDLYQQKDKRIKVVHKQNGGQSSARNAGLRIATGESIGFVDSDDWIEQDMYEVLESVLSEYSADMATCKIVENDALNQSADVEVLDMEAAMKSLMIGGSVTNSVCDKLISKRCFDNVTFPENMIMEDAATIYRCILQASSVVVTNHECYHYRIREESTLHSVFSEKNFDSVKATKMRLDEIAVTYPPLKQVAFDGYLWTALYCIWWADHVAHGKFEPNRKQIAKELIEYIDGNKDIVVAGKINRVKIGLLRFGIPVFDFVWNSYHKVLRILHI